MPSGLVKTSSNHFEIKYEQPWGGVNSSQDPVDIADNEFVVQRNLLDIDGVLCYAGFAGDPNNYKFPVNPTEIANLIPYIALMFTIAGNIYAIDSFGNIFAAQFNLTFNWALIATAPDGPWFVAVGTPPNEQFYFAPPTAVKVVNGVAYIANYVRNTIYTFDGTTFAVGSNYTGGLVLGVLDDYLLQMNTNSQTDGVQPNRVNWSGPGKFTTWDPSVDRTAGFNTLAEVEDRLTGFFSFASIGVILTAKGLVQMTPTGVGIQPFNFSTLWTSDIGQGCVYPNTSVQYGQYGLFATDTGSYKVATSGITEISQKARTAILSSLQYAGVYDIKGTVVVYAKNANYSTAYYMFGSITAPNAVAGDHAFISLWCYDLLKGTWALMEVDCTNIVNTQYSIDSRLGSIQNVGLFTLDGQTTSNQPYLINNAELYPTTFLTFNYIDQTVGSAPVVYQCCCQLYFVKNNVTAPDFLLPGIVNLVFKANEIKLGFTRKTTLRRVVVKGYGTGTLVFTVTDANGQTYPMGAIILDGTSVSKTYYSDQGISTVEAPQLAMETFNFKGVIVKAMLTGTYADGDID